MVDEFAVVLPAVSDDLVSRRLRQITRKLAEAGVDTESHAMLFGGEDGYGAEYDNGIFEMHPFWWGECTCEQEPLLDAWAEAHPTVPAKDYPEELWCLPTCKHARPNFRCGDFEVTWHKYIGRGMVVCSAGMTTAEVEAMFDRCEESVDNTPPADGSLSVANGRFAR